MRILFITPYPPVVDGIGDYSVALADELRAQGHEIRVIAARPGAGTTRAEVMGTLPRSRSELRTTVAAVKEWSPHVVHLQFAVASFGTRTPAVIRLMRALASLPARRVVTLHEVTRDTASLRGAGRAVYRRVSELANVNVVHTRAAWDALAGAVGVDPARIQLVPHPRRGLPVATATAGELRFRHGLGDSRVLLAFGFIHVDKGLDDLVRACAILRDDPTLADVRLVVAGQVRTRATAFKVFELRDRLHLRKVRKLVRRSGIGERVLFTGYVPSGELRPWFELCEAAVLPYVRIEQSGVASLAAGAGAPVLASEVGGLGHEFSGERWTYPARDPDALANVLRDFLQTPAGDRPALPGGDAEPNLAEVAATTAALYGAPDPLTLQEVAHAG
jgi:glycosyltransferase involved in cell wall biosynthesis